MKVRKLAVALAVAGGLGSSVVQALGLGEVELQSYLNEPLNAEIALLKTEGVSPDNIIVELASEQSYKRLGLSRNFFLSNLKFNVTTAPNGQLVIDVTSREPVREPYLDFLIEVTWPSGRLMREYSVLVDPPVYAEKSGLKDQVRAPAAASVTPATQNRGRTSAPRPAATSSAGSVSGGTFGPTGVSDTLWGIASQVRPNNRVTQQQTMLAIQDLNPDAFIDGNINRLKRGEVLRIPTLSQIQQRSQAQANREVRAQNQAMKPSSRPVDATARTADSGGGAPAAASGDELKLIAPGKETTVAADEGASAGGASSASGGVDAGKAAALEELDKARRSNDELNSRVNDLQSQVETLQRLIELKNSQLADLQNQEAKTQAPEANATATDSTMAAESGSTTTAPGNDQAAEEAASTGSDSMTAGAAGEPSADNQPADTLTAENESPESMGGSAPSDSAANDTSEMADSAQPKTAETQPEVAAEPEKAAEPAAPAEKPEPVTSVADKGFPATVIDLIANNRIYQIALGGGLVLLLLMLLALARRNANREKAFYDELNRDSDGESDGFDLDLEETDEPLSESDDGSDPLSEAEAYIAYGRLDQAAQTLETAISREPSRTDLRLKLLAVYADNQDRESFEKQYRELDALQDDEATAEATALRARLEEAEAMPSIDDLESQLRSDSFGNQTESAIADDELVFGEQDTPEESGSDTDDQFDGAFDELDLDDESTDEDKEEVSDSQPAEQDEATDSSDRPIEYDLSGLNETTEKDDEDSLELDDLDSETTLDDDDDFGIDFESESGSEATTEDDDLLSLEPESGEEEPLELDDEFASLDLDDAGIDNRETGDTAETGDGSGIGDTADEELPSLDDDDLGTTEDGVLDESFLDELDAELEKVAGEDSEEESRLTTEDNLDDLELDVSDEDLALMEEVADSDSGTTDDTDDLSLDEELGLEDTLAEDTSSEDSLTDEDDVPVVDSGAVVPDKDKPAKAASGAPELEETDLGDEDDFDFLSGTDEAATKLDLARAYIEMGDTDGARDILEEVSIEGSEEQKAEAQDLLKNLS